MALFTTDYSNLESNDFSPLPEGEYEVIIKSATERASDFCRWMETHNRWSI